MRSFAAGWGSFLVLFVLLLTTNFIDGTTSLEATPTPSTNSTYFPPNCLLRGRVTNVKKCSKLRKFVQITPRCEAARLILGLPFNVGNEKRCIKECGWRAVEECSLVLSNLKKTNIDCGTQKSPHINHMLRKKFKLYCRKQSPWYADGGCKYPSGLREQGCSSVKCPARCAMMEGCGWSRGQGPPYYSPEEVRARSSRYTWYTGRCEIRVPLT